MSAFLKLFCVAGLCFPVATFAGKLPNILILFADDLGYGDLSIQNPKSRIPTPNLDQLARESMRFSDGHSSSGICTPSRYALLTGRHHWRDFHNIVGAFGESVFAPERVTLPEMLKAKGYATAAIGKWHLGWDWDAIKKPNAEPIAVPDQGKKRNRKVFTPDAFDWTQSIPNGPLAHGFDYYFGDTVINFPPYCWIENDKVVNAPDMMLDTTMWKPIKEGNFECRMGPMYSGWDPYENIPTTTAKGVRYIRERAGKDQPFFLYFAFPSPHAPIIPNDEFDGKSEAGAYGDFVFETDDACGKLLKALKESGQADNTIVLFSADNGPEKYAYRRDEKYDHWSAEPFRGLKRDLYEGGHHVPLFIRWPSRVKPSMCDALVSQVDIMATLASIVGFELPNDCAEDSHDLLPLLTGEVEQVRATHIHNTKADHWAIRSGEWNLIQSPNGYHSGRNQAWESKRNYAQDNGSPVELYHFSKDPAQREDLAAELPEKVAQLQSLLTEIRQQGYSAPRLAK